MPEAERFGVIRLRGGRYEQLGLPLVAIAELGRYEKLVHNVARSLYLREHPNRKRVPRGPAFELALRLTAVEPGSVKPVLERALPTTEALFATEHDWFEESRRLINEALRGFNDEQSHLIANFPADCLDDFSAVGRSLAADESIEFSDVHGDTPPAILNVDVRKRIVRHTKLGHLDVETLLIGRVTGLRSQPAKFDFKVEENGRKFEGSYHDDGMFSQLKSVMDEEDRASLVALSAVARQTPDGETVELVDVLAVELTLPDTWRERLSQLARLQAGWLDKGSSPPSAQALDQTERLLLGCLDEMLPRPGIFPTPEGGLQLEWTSPDSETEVRISADGSVHVLWFSTSTDDDREADYSPDDDLANVATFIRAGVQ